ncbi:zinc transporter 5-like [Rutidosis leptorrhynchoides]|uniref:zinc transporter 5-like n=1 Tax=Rutidosis leptorrhynchoides TaxID=125765 RepID=UPI003A9960AA
MKLHKLTLVTLFLSTVITTKVFADCTCERDEITGNKNQALAYKLIALVSILVAGSIGVSLPFASNIFPALHPEKDDFFLVKAFAAGVILATGFIHILPDAFENLKSPCLKEHPWADFPFTGFVAMVATIATQMFESLSLAYERKDKTETDVKLGGGGEDEEKGGRVHTNHQHVHGSFVLPNEDESQVYRYRIISKVLELGIIVHSVIIGLSLGVSKSPKTIKPLIVALSFHQFFEGLGLGGCIFQAKIKYVAVILMGVFFAFTTPSGILIGIFVSKTYEEDTPTALIVQGVLNAAASGILIYMALVDLISPDFKNQRMQNNKILLLSSSVSLLVGAGLMSLLAKWA